MFKRTATMFLMFVVVSFFMWGYFEMMYSPLEITAQTFITSKFVDSQGQILAETTDVFEATFNGIEWEIPYDVVFGKGTNMDAVAQDFLGQGKNVWTTGVFDANGDEFLNNSFLISSKHQVIWGRIELRVSD